MISFEVLKADNADAVIRGLTEKCPCADSEYLSDIAEQLLSSDDSCEYALSVAAGCLLIRVFDGEYFFLFPEPIAENYDEMAAVRELPPYAIREEIPLVISEVPREALSDVEALFANTETEKEDAEGNSFTIGAVTEISLVEELPQASDGDMALTSLCLSDEERYSSLCRDDETNKYWGYNYCEDAPDCEDSWFIESAAREFSRGVAASFAVRYENIFIGEAVLYAFDFMGGAECAVRFLSEYRGRALSGRCIELLCRVSRGLGLKRLYATVDNRNITSIKLFSKSFDLIEKNNDISRFVRKM